MPAKNCMVPMDIHSRCSAGSNILTYKEALGSQLVYIRSERAGPTHL